MSQLVDLLHDYVDQYDRVSSTLEAVEDTLTRLRQELAVAESVNRTLVKECADLKAAQSLSRSKHDYVHLRSVLARAEIALRAVTVTSQSLGVTALVNDALAAIDKL